MFTLLTQKSASSQVFWYQYVPFLRREGISVDPFPPSSIGLNERMTKRALPRLIDVLLKVAYWYLIVPATRLVQIMRACRADVVLIQRGLLRARSAPVLEFLLWLLAKKLCGAALVYQYDDALFLTARPSYSHWRFRLSDFVLTGNEQLAKYARDWNPNVRLLEGVVDLDRYRPTRHRHKDVVVVGWTGIVREDLRPLIEAMGELSRCDGLRLRIAGTPEMRDITGPRIEHVEWSPERETAILQTFDIGAMPLPDTEYNRCRESYKLKLYMASGLPVVASPVGKNLALVVHGVNGFFARTTEDWVTYILALRKDSGLRERMGAAGRQLMEERYALSVDAPKFAEFLKGLARRPGHSRFG